MVAVVGVNSAEVEAVKREDVGPEEVEGALEGCPRPLLVLLVEEEGITAFVVPAHSLPMGIII